MRLDILIVSYNRPDYLAALMASLNNQHSGSWKFGDVHLMQDGPNLNRLVDDTKQVEQCIHAFQRAFPTGQVHDTPVNIGINGNYQKIVRHMAASQADAVIVFEDDLELSPHYLNVMSRLLDYAGTSPHIGMVSAKGLLGATLEQQTLRQRALMPMGSAWGIHRWGWGMARNAISEYAPILEMYLDFALRLGFPDNGDAINRAEKFPDLQRFINHMGFYQTTDGVEIDTMYDVAAYALGRINLCTYANFLNPIGERGLHYDEDLFKKSNLHNAVMFDAPPDEFAWYEPDMMLNILTLIRRFHASVRLNYNSGFFGCPCPYGGLANVDMVRSLYEDVFGWPLTEDDLVAHKYHNFEPGKKFWDAEAKGLLRNSVPKEKQYSFPYAV